MTLVGINYKKVTGLTFLPLLEQAPYQLQEKVITKMIFSNYQGINKVFKLSKKKKHLKPRLTSTVINNEMCP